MNRFWIVVRFLGKRQRAVLVLLAGWTFTASWLFTWMTSQAGLREGIAKLLKILPMKLQDSFAGDITMMIDPAGFLVSAYDHPLLSVPFMFWAMLLPLRHIASEQERGLLDIVLVRPISRRTWLTAILFWQVAGLMVVTCTAVSGMVLGCMYYPELQNIRPGVLLGYGVMQALWALSIGGFTAIFAARWGRFRLALGGAFLFTLIMILSEVLCRSIRSWKPYIIFSLRHWAEPHTLFPTGWSGSGVLVLLTTGVCAWVVAALLFQRHDLGAK